ncbi:MAG: tRNA (guanosine(37)-N1)-methyltransferase TrmD [Eggerthellaceae bacterium]|nr:tRNA (guanosine(37)-N1)-methyltransferase TrmD [Eggerthellaceae bacterium]
MRIETLSTFPDMFSSVMGSSIMKRAQDKGILEFCAYDLRDWTHDRHRTTDDDPYGGGSGLIMKCEPIFEAMDELSKGVRPHVIFMGAQGRRFDDEAATRLSKMDRLLFVCGHYEGIDERAFCLADDIISLGDYILTSGELASMVVIDAVVRKITGVLGADDGAQNESFADGLLEYPQYTRPATYRGMDVPDVLLSLHNEKVDEWRRRQSLESTYSLGPDVLEDAPLSVKDLEFLKSLDRDKTGCE